MTGVHAAVFKAIHEGKWLTIEYRNRNEQTTRYWIAIRELQLPRGVLVVDGLHLGQLTVQELSIYLDRIRSAELVEGSWCPVNEALVADMEENPNKYAALFGSPVNLRVLDYLAACNRLDSVALQDRLCPDPASGRRFLFGRPFAFERRAVPRDRGKFSAAEPMPGQPEAVHPAAGAQPYQC